MERTTIKGVDLTKNRVRIKSKIGRRVQTQPDLGRGRSIGVDKVGNPQRGKRLEVIELTT